MDHYKLEAVKGGERLVVDVHLLTDTPIVLMFSVHPFWRRTWLLIAIIVSIMAVILLSLHLLGMRRSLGASTH
jgi:hypothetical protein